MKRRFVKISFALCVLLIMTAPVQALALEKDCNRESINQLTNCSNIYTQITQGSLQKLIGNCSQLFSGKLDQTQLQSLLNQCGFNACSNQISTDAKQTTAPAKAAPVKKAPPAAVPTKATADKATPAAVPTKATADKATPAAAPTKATPATADKVTAAPAKAATPAPATTASSNLGSYEQQVVNLVNKERAAAGLSALKVNTKLANVAETKAADLRDENYFSHTSPKYGSPFDMMKQFGISYTAAGENIAKGQRTPEEVMNGWMNSQGHRENILNANFTEIGVGYVTDSNGTGYWVQEFIRP